MVRATEGQKWGVLAASDEVVVGILSSAQFTAARLYSLLLGKLLTLGLVGSYRIMSLVKRSSVSRPACNAEAFQVEGSGSEAD